MSHELYSAHNSVYTRPGVSLSFLHAFLMNEVVVSYTKCYTNDDIKEFSFIIFISDKRAYYFFLITNSFFG